MTGDSREEIGPYLVYEQLGSGGMATVHRAEQRGIEGFRRVVALKRLHANVAADPELLRSFIHEARLASYLKHTNVAQTFDLGKVGETYFIAMEFVPGPTLAQLMRQCAKAAGPIPLGIVLTILIQICDALDHAHNLCDESGEPLGIIHRDISPSNVIVSNSGTVKLIDFGIAKASNSDVRTQTGMIKGKFGYIAPEYLTGQLDPRGDLFGVGVIAHELLAGRSLFLGRNDFDTLNRLREMPISPPSLWNPTVTSDLEDIVMTALQRDPELRWQSAAAMRTALYNVLRELGLVVGTQQVFEWVEWAFSQLPSSEASALRRAIDALDEPSVLIDAQGRGAGVPTASSLATTSPDLLAAPLPSSRAPGGSPPSGFAPAPAGPPETLPPETLPASAFAPETLPASAFAPETLPAEINPSATAPSLPPLHLPPAPAPAVDPAAKLAAAMLAPTLPAPVSAPKLVSAPQSGSTRSRSLSTPPVMVTRDKPPSVPPPRDKPPSVPPGVRAKPASVPPPSPPPPATNPPPSPAGKGPPPPPPDARAKPASMPPPPPADARAKPASMPPPPPSPPARPGASRPPPVRPSGELLAATDLHLPRFDAFDTPGSGARTPDPFATTSPMARTPDPLDGTGPTVLGSTEVDATAPVPRDDDDRPSASSISRPTIDDSGSTNLLPAFDERFADRADPPAEPSARPSEPPARRSLTELAGLRPVGGPATPGAPAPAPSAPPARPSRRARASKEPPAADDPHASGGVEIAPPKEAKRRRPERAEPEAGRSGGRWWLGVLLMLLAACGAAAAAYHFGYMIEL